MKEMNLDFFKDNIDLIKDLYNKCDYYVKRSLKEDIYANNHLNVFEKDVIWAYLNEETDSPFFMSYEKFLERCKFYEDNSRLYPTNDK